ncbi:hypothetical protein CAEBREN_24034 [Caenorhabditis brenneri]|uniref:Uncharacterized protein n=1 Tax=Caenorhabditis brenneri TaxID=135651 RepID=G0MCY5_CAEBE|nr:hypothetical protein CAEBREN_24034 [Caenorhabditis brenneri]
MIFSTVENLTFPGVFHNFYDNFEESLKGIQSYKSLLKFVSFLSCSSTFITVLIVWNASGRLKIEYRNILLAQLILAFCGCFLISLISPSFLLPFPMIFLSGPFAIDYRLTCKFHSNRYPTLSIITVYLSSIVVLLYFFPTMLLLSFGLIYNYMSLKQLASVWFHISVERFLKCLIFLVTVFLFSGNCFLISQVSRSQSDMQKKIVDGVDSRCAKIFEKYAVFVFDIYSIPIKLASLEALMLSFVSVVFCIILTVLSCKHFTRQKNNMSAATSKNHRMMMYMLVSYVAHFLIYFSFPLAAFTMAIHDVKPFLGNYTFLFIISPAHFLGISLSVTYCLIISPYRKVCIAILLLLSCTVRGNPREQSSASNSSISVIDNIMRRHSYRVSASYS